MSQSAIFRDSDRKSKKRNTEENRRNKADKNRSHVCSIYLPLGNGANETEMAIVGTWMHQAMRGMTGGKQTGEEQQDGEQTCEGGICYPLRANRFSPFLQAQSINHVTTPSASPKSRV